MKVLYIDIEGKHCYTGIYNYEKPTPKPEPVGDVEEREPNPDEDDIEDDEEQVFAFDIEEVWGDSSFIDAISEMCGATFTYNYISNKPMILVDSGVNVTQLYSYAKMNSFKTTDINLIQQILTVFNKSNMICCESDIVLFLNQLKKFDDYINSDDTKICLDYSNQFEVDEDIKSLINKQAGGYPKPANNKTLFMNTEESEVFVHIPSLTALKEGFYNLPEQEAINAPYGELSKEDRSILYSTKIYTYINEGGKYVTLEDYIFGLPENNSNFNEENTPQIYQKDEHGIYPNEKRYYNELIKLLTFGMLENNTKEEIGGDIGENEEIIKDYVVNLAESFAKINWCHTGKIPVSRDNENSDEDDGSDYGSLEIMPRYDHLNDHFIDPQYVIKDVYNISRNLKSPDIFAEFLIKLLRWGNRKPTAIVWSNPKVSVEFNLDTFLLDRKKEFNIFEAKQTEFDGGYLYRLSGLIKTNDPLKCKEVTGVTVAGSIIGIVADRRFEYKDSKGEIKYEHQKVFMSLLDVLELMKDSPKAFQNITTVDNKIVVNEDHLESFRLREAITITSQNKDKMKILHQSKKISSLFLTLGIEKKDTNYLSVLNRCLFYKQISGFIEQEFVDTEDAAKKIKREKMLAVESHIFAKIYKPFINILEFDGGAMERLPLDMMLNRLKESAGDSLNQPLFSGKGSIGTASARSALAQHMNIGEKEGVTLAEAKEMYRDVMVKTGDFNTFIPVYFNKSDLENPDNIEIFLGVSTNNEKAQYSIFHRDTIPTDTQITFKGRQSLTRLLLGLTLQQSSTILGHWENCQFVFGNIKSVSLFGKYVQNILNRGK